MNVKEQKKQLRSRIRQKKEQYSHEWVSEQSKAVIERVLNTVEYQTADVIVCYVSMGKEVDTFSILEHAWNSGKRVGVPLCRGKGIMEIREICSRKDLQPGAYGILEPIPGMPVIEKEEIQYAIVPCVCCDKKKRRLGHGAGYYDRYLTETVFTKAALCLEAMLVENVPVDDYDILMDQVITENEVIV